MTTTRTDALRELIAKWRKGGYFNKSTSREVAKCADELEAVLVSEPLSRVAKEARCNFYFGGINGGSRCQKPPHDDDEGHEWYAAKEPAAQFLATLEPGELAGIQAGLAYVAAGRVRPLEEIKAELEVNAQIVEQFMRAVEYLQSHGYKDWNGTANGQTITLTGCANMMREYAAEIAAGAQPPVKGEDAVKANAGRKKMPYHNLLERIRNFVLLDRSDSDLKRMIVEAFKTENVDLYKPLPKAKREEYGVKEDDEQST